MSIEKNQCKVITSKNELVVFSYPYVFTPRPKDPDDLESEKQYSVVPLISKKHKTNIARIKAAIEAAIQYGIETNKDWKGKRPKNLTLPLHDGDEKFEEKDEDPKYASYCGNFYLNARTKDKPGIVNLKGDAISEDAFYPGCKGVISVSFFPFFHKGKYGVGVALNHCAKTADGERLAGRASVEDDFSDIYEEGDDEEMDFN